MKSMSTCRSWLDMIKWLIHIYISLLADFCSDLDDTSPVLVDFLPESNLDGYLGTSTGSSRELDLIVSGSRSPRYRRLTPEMASIKEDFPLD
jgi:hypothetical protein